MTDPKMPVTEDELHAYVDNELPAERRDDVEAWLVAHPDDAERVHSWQAMAEALHARYNAVIDEPVPRRLELEQLDRLAKPTRRWVYGAVAASLLAFVVGGGTGWLARGASATPTTFQAFTDDALDAHRLYVVDVRHPVEVPGDERAHLQQWLTRRCGRNVEAPELGSTGLKLVGGRLLPGPTGPAAFFMYEGASGERYTVYAAKSSMKTMQMRFTSQDKDGTKDGAMFWADGGVGYVVSGTSDRDRLNQIARVVYDQSDKGG